MTSYQWKCEFCGQHQMVTDANYHDQFQKLDVGTSKHGEVGLFFAAIRCVNPDCNEVYIEARFDRVQWNRADWVSVQRLEYWKLRPESAAVVLPSYIPEPLIEDYYEACRIRDKSPKASATLARRCLQGMIRDFCKISKSRLIDEIRELKQMLDAGTAPKGVELETVDAIDAVREVGNIGAHMEKDISLIIEVDPGEAQALIELVEMLFEEWYVARYKREERLANVKLLAAQKSAEILQARADAAAAKAIPDDSSVVPENP